MNEREKAELRNELARARLAQEKAVGKPKREIPVSTGRVNRATLFTFRKDLSVPDMVKFMNRILKER
jgi:hypothetical protein